MVWLSINEFARWKGIPKSTILQWIREGKLTAIEKNGILLIWIGYEIKDFDDFKELFLKWLQTPEAKAMIVSQYATIDAIYQLFNQFLSDRNIRPLTKQEFMTYLSRLFKEVDIPEVKMLKKAIETTKLILKA